MVIVHARIADFNVEFRSTYYFINAICRPYNADFTQPDIEIEITEDEANKAYEEGLKEGFTYGPGYYEATIGFRKLSAKLVDFDAFVLHGAVFSVDDSDGVVLCALSGTGKTTHMLLWQKMLGDRFKFINGDKPIIRFIDNVPYAYGTPWNGKEHFGCNAKVQLKNICFIERSKTNEVLNLEKRDATQRLSTQMVQPENIKAIFKNMEFMDKLYNTCKTYIIKCNMEPEAAMVAYDAIFN